MLKIFIKLFIIFFCWKNVSLPFYVVHGVAVGDFGCSAHGSNFVAHTATLEVKLSSRTLADIMKAQLLPHVWGYKNSKSGGGAQLL